jgi:activator of 2-hydroxyglutaryl-CoA dehydratase
MKDQCAAVTSKFLEIIAKTLEYDIEQFDGEALLSEEDASIE